MNVVCLVVDGLQSGMLGPYGNSWIDTPQLNRLAGEGFVFHQALVDSPHLSDVCRSLWTGAHARTHVESVSLPARLAEAGVNTSLISDVAEVVEHPLAHDFREVAQLSPSAADSIVDQWHETQLARFFAQAVEQLRGLREPFVQWIHAGGLAGRWDAPAAIRERYLADEDLPPELVSRLYELTTPSPACATPYDDPDELLLTRLAHAAQVSVFDTCLAALNEVLREAPFADRTLLLLWGARGFPLGGHGQLGFADYQLYSQLTQVPCLMHCPATIDAGRSQALAQPADVAATVLACYEIASTSHGAGAGVSLLNLVEGRVRSHRDRALLCNHQGATALRTQGWYLIRNSCQVAPAAEASATAELYAKPDDRWEVNEVAVRLPHITAQLGEALDELELAIEKNSSDPLTALNPLLIEGAV